VTTNEINEAPVVESAILM